MLMSHLSQQDTVLHKDQRDPPLSANNNACGFVKWYSYWRVLNLYFPKVSEWNITSLQLRLETERSCVLNTATARGGVLATLKKKNLKPISVLIIGGLLERVN